MKSEDVLDICEATLKATKLFQDENTTNIWFKEFNLHPTYLKEKLNACRHWHHSPILSGIMFFRYGRISPEIQYRMSDFCGLKFGHRKYCERITQFAYDLDINMLVKFARNEKVAMELFKLYTNSSFEEFVLYIPGFAAFIAENARE